MFKSNERYFRIKSGALSNRSILSKIQTRTPSANDNYEQEQKQNFMSHKNLGVLKMRKRIIYHRKNTFQSLKQSNQNISEHTSQNFFDCIGKIVSFFKIKTQEGVKILKCEGIGTLISEKLVLTAASNLFRKTDNLRAFKSTFYPFREQINQEIPKKGIRFKQLFIHPSYINYKITDKKNQIHSIALCQLNQNQIIKENNFLEVAWDSSFSNQSNHDLLIINENKLSNILQYSRSALSKQRQFLLYYNNQIADEMIGSPILYRSTSIQSYKIIGIHIGSFVKKHFNTQIETNYGVILNSSQSPKLTFLQLLNQTKKSSKIARNYSSPFHHNQIAQLTTKLKQNQNLILQSTKKIQDLQKQNLNLLKSKEQIQSLNKKLQECQQKNHQLLKQNSIAFFYKQQNSMLKQTIQQLQKQKQQIKSQYSNKINQLDSKINQFNQLERKNTVLQQDKHQLMQKISYLEQQLQILTKSENYLNGHIIEKSAYQYQQFKMKQSSKINIKNHSLLTNNDAQINLIEDSQDQQQITQKQSLIDLTQSNPSNNHLSKSVISQQQLSLYENLYNYEPNPINLYQKSEIKKPNANSNKLYLLNNQGIQLQNQTNKNSSYSKIVNSNKIGQKSSSINTNLYNRSRYNNRQYSTNLRYNNKKKKNNKNYLHNHIQQYD